MFKSLIIFLSLYFLGIIFLLIYKEIQNYSNYVIPDHNLITSAFLHSIIRYSNAAFITFSTAFFGHTFATIFAFLTAIIIIFFKGIGEITKLIAYTLQSYPIVAIIPLLFIIIGDNNFTKLIITGSISYFPILISLIGILSQPVNEVENFFKFTNRNDFLNLFKIRISERLQTVIEVIIGSATLAVVGSIVAEFVTSNSGIGYEIRIAHNKPSLELILVALFVIGIVNWLYLSILKILGMKLHLLIIGKNIEKNHYE